MATDPSAILTAKTDNALIDWREKRYLIIDDFPNMRVMLRDILRNLGVRNVDQAASGSEAVAALGRSRYDVVLCDYHLGPGRNGQQVLEEAKIRDLVGPASIWLMISAEKSVESVMGAAEFQPDGYLIKPITEALLLARLNRIWSKKQVFKAIDEAYAVRDYLKAAQLCDKKLASDKLHVLELLRMKASLLVKCGEPDQAQAVYEQILAQREFPWARVGLAKIHLQNEDHDQARTMLREVIEVNPYYLDAYDQLATAHQQLGEFAEAEQVLQKAAKLSPNSVLRQKNLGTVALRLGKLDVAERALRKSIEVGAHSILKTPEAYLGLARVHGQKGNPGEALQLLATVQKEFATPMVQLQAKITEGLAYHEAGDWVKARKSADEMTRLWDELQVRPDVSTTLDVARLMFAVGVKDKPVELLCDLVRNNHDNDILAADVRLVLDQGRLGDQADDLIIKARKEATDMMNRGVLLWKEGKTQEAIDWMRHARNALPGNVRILFNCAHVLVSSMQKQGVDEVMASEVREILLQAEIMAPNQRRFAQLMTALEAMAPAPVAAAVAAD